jgi:AraC-like DNA-binding protein
LQAGGQIGGKHGDYGNLCRKGFHNYIHKGNTLADASHSNGPSTLMDVARQAGVSPSTVSRILNGTAKVSDEKRQAVLAAIEQMNFAPNQMAQGLKKAAP